MKLVKGSAAIAAAALLTLGAFARADDAAASTEQAAAPAPLMALLGKAGLKDTLDKANIDVRGYVEGSYTWNFDQPRSDTNFGRGFDFEHDEALLNQVDLIVERTVDVSKKQFDIGGAMEWIYGEDAGFLHSNGLFDWYDNPRDPEEQFDPAQAYLDFSIPVGNGLLVRAGKFIALHGYETVNPNPNAFYSHSFLFQYSAPFAHTGVLATYAVNDEWTFSAGITRGWDQATEDNNGSIDFLGQAKWTISQKTAAVVSLSVGPQQPNDSGDYRTLFDVILTHQVNDKISLAANADFGWESNASANGDTAYWYGIAGYFGYKLCDACTFNTRLEWFRDEEGSRSGFSDNYYEATIGLTITPFPKDNIGKGLLIRPELRADYASADAVFNDGDDHRQFTAAVDAIFNF